MLSKILELAWEFAIDMDTELKEFPNNTFWAELSSINDLVLYCSNQSGNDRTYTYELSNLWSHLRPQINDQISLERVLFTQGGMAAGPAIGLNCVNVRGRALVIVVTWQQGIVEETLIDHLIHDINTYSRKKLVVLVSQNRDSKQDQLVIRS